MRHTDLDKGRRKKLWQIEERLHCSIVGTCLTPAELRLLCRKANLAIHAGMADYELHSAFVAIAGKPCHAARLLQRHLDGKYGSVLRRFSRARSVEELAALWEEALEDGKVAGAWWALVTHPSTPDDLLMRAYGEVHMLSHLASVSIRRELRELVVLRRRVAELRGELARCRSLHVRRIEEKAQEIRRLQERPEKACAVERELSRRAPACWRWKANHWRGRSGSSPKGWKLVSPVRSRPKRGRQSGGALPGARKNARRISSASSSRPGRRGTRWSIPWRACSKAAARSHPWRPSTGDAGTWTCAADVSSTWGAGRPNAHTSVRWWSA